MTTKPIVLEAGWPISDSNFTRNHGFLAGIRAAKNFLVDLVSFHMCTKLILESLEQKKRCRNRFLLQSSKIEVVLTGVNEERFHNCSSRKPPELDKQHKPIVLFRGKYNVESGLEKILQSSFKIENDVQLVIATDRILGIECDNSKVTLIHRKLADAEIHYLYKNSVLSIGQISDHGRVNYTIPHKFFESAYFGLPYLTMQNSAVTKLTHGLGIFQLKNATSDELGNLVNSIVKSRLVLQTKSVEIANLYTRILKQSKLQESFSKIILDILK